MVLAGAVLVTCLAWSAPAAAIVPQVRREPPRVSAARRVPVTHPLTVPHVDFKFGYRLEAVVSRTRDGQPAGCLGGPPRLPASGHHAGSGCLDDTPA